MNNKSQFKSAKGRASKKKNPSPYSPMKNMAPVAIAHRQVSGKPKITMKDGVTTISQKELIGNLSGSVGWTIQATLQLNPGLPATFAWLSRIARNFEMYRFKKLAFRYIPRCSTSTAGSVQLIPEYDASDSPPASEQEASSYSGCCEDVAWKEIVLQYRRDLMSLADNWRFVRSGSVPAGSDIKLYDLGIFFAATADGGASAYGKLWVDYEVEFKIPQLEPGSLGPIPYGGSIVAATFVGSANERPLGETQTFDAQDNGIAIDNSSPTFNRLVFSYPGDYVVACRCTGVGLSAVVLAASGLTLLSQEGFQNTAGTNFVRYARIRVTEALQYLVLQSTNTSLSAGTLCVGRAPDGSLN